MVHSPGFNNFVHHQAATTHTVTPDRDRGGYFGLIMQSPSQIHMQSLLHIGCKQPLLPSTRRTFRAISIPLSIMQTTVQQANQFWIPAKNSGRGSRRGPRFLCSALIWRGIGQEDVVAALLEYAPAVSRYDSCPLRLL